MIRRERVLCCTQEPWGADAFRLARRFDWLRSWRILRLDADADASDADYAFTAALYEHDPEVVFVLHWRHIIRANFAAWHVVNFHCTPLPYGRGGSPIENMILAGHRHTTLTAHRMTAAVDAGSIYATRTGISLDGGYQDILGRFAEPAAEMMRDIVRGRYVPRPQVGVARQFKRLTPEERDRFWRGRPYQAKEGSDAE